MSKLSTIARVLLGLIFLVFGLNGFLNFLPMPAHPGASGEFLKGLAASGYFFPFLKGVEVLAGALLLLGAFVPLVLVVLAPIVINIVLFHALLDPAGVVLPLVILGLEGYLLLFAKPYRSTTRQLLVR